MFSTYITKGYNGISYLGIYDTISIIHVLPILLFYFIAFPRLTQKTPHELLVYKTHWLQSTSVMLGLLGSCLSVLLSVEGLLGVFVGDRNVLDMLSLSIAVSMVPTIYGFTLAFCFLMISIFFTKYFFYKILNNFLT